MRAMLLVEQKKPLVLGEVEIPTPREHEVLIRIHACGVCRTDLHILDGDLKAPHLPLILGHQIVGTLVSGANKGKRVGVPWLGETCQVCSFCQNGKENLCDFAQFTGYSKNGGYAEYCVANEEYLMPLPDAYDDLHVAPLLCAGLIGYRAFRLAGDVESIGFYGFGSSAHLLLQIAHYLGKKTYVFTRSGDKKTQEFAYSLGADYAGDSDQLPPRLLDAALIFAPVGALYPHALRAVKKGGKVISAGIHMSDIPSFPYQLLWEERSMSSVANLTREDGKQFLALAEKFPLKVAVTVFPLEEANEALGVIRQGGKEGSCVLVV